MKKLFFSILFTHLLTVLPAQSNIDWFTLQDVEFEKVEDEEFGLSYDKASFGQWPKSFDEQEVAIAGYMIPMDALGTSWALSLNPNASCFFCKGAGPETVIRLWMQSDAVKRYKTDEYMTWQGTLRINETNQYNFIYELWEAKPAR